MQHEETLAPRVFSDTDHMDLYALQKPCPLTSYPIPGVLWLLSVLGFPPFLSDRRCVLKLT